MTAIRRTALLLALTSALAACNKGDKAAASSATPASSDQPAAQASSGSAHEDVVSAAMMQNYRLTADKVDRVIQANANIAKLMAANPELRRQLDRQGDMNDPKTLNEMIERLNSIQPVHQALASAGISARDWVLTVMTTFGAQMAAELEKRGLSKKLPYAVSAENVAFVSAHQEQIQQLTTSLDAMSQTDSTE
jgi:hypothetical protein